jgi:probable HAF family extracellular repeat protein
VNTSGQAAGKQGAAPIRYSAKDGLQTLDYTAFIEDSPEIDSRGFVVGTQGNTSTSARLWDLAGDAQGLGTLESDSVNGSVSGARAINDRRQVVGYHWPQVSSLGDHAAFLWEQGRMIDLNLLMPPGTPWQLTSAGDINDAGQILGTGDSGSTTNVGFLMTLSSEAEEVTRLCRGWCEPIQRCGRDATPWTISTDIWTRPNYPNGTGCVNGCVAFMMDPARPHTLAQERQVRDCFLAGGAGLCTENWELKTQQCCTAQGLASCNVYYP